jgi:hypothetical protein
VSEDKQPGANSAPGKPDGKPDGKPRTMRKARVRARRWPAVLAGTTTAVIAAGAVAAATVLPGNPATAIVTGAPVVLPVGNTVNNCVAPTRLLTGTAVGTDPQYSPDSSSSTSTLNALLLSTPGGVLPGASLNSLDGSGAPLETLTPSPSATATPAAGLAKLNAVNLGATSVSADTVLNAAPVGGQRAVVSGAVVVSTPDGDLQGLAAANCQEPSNDLWLAGASTTVGRTAVLNVVNSSQTAATINLDLYGSDGPIQAAGGKGLLIPAGKSRAIVLAGLAPNQNQLSMRLKSTGGPVTATIQQSVLRGLTAGGVDYLQPVEAPSNGRVITGVQVQAPADAAKISGQSGYADATAAVEVTIPGNSDAVVEVKVFGPGGQAALPNGGVVTAKAGSVTEVPLAGLPAGTYTLSLSSDTPLTATARMVDSTKPGEPVDFAYSPAAARVGDNQLVTLPKGQSSLLSFAAGGAHGSVQLVPVKANGDLGKAATVDLNGGTNVVVDPVKLVGADAVGLVVSATGDAVYAAQVLSSAKSAGIAVLPFPSTTANGHSVNVVLGY